MDNIYAITFTSPDGNEMTVEVEGYSSQKALDRFEEEYQFDETKLVEAQLVSNRRDY